MIGGCESYGRILLIDLGIGSWISHIWVRRNENERRVWIDGAGFLCTFVCSSSDETMI